MEGGQPPVTPRIYRDQATGDEADNRMAKQVATVTKPWNVVTGFFRNMPDKSKREAYLSVWITKTHRSFCSFLIGSTATSWG